GRSGAARSRMSRGSSSRRRETPTRTAMPTSGFTYLGSRELGMSESAALRPGVRVNHAEHGEGVVVAAARNGYVRGFFSGGERLVAVAALQPFQSRSDRILAGVGVGADRAREAWLAYEAHALPLMESAAALTSAPIDLLPHQVVLTHRVATASPRRFLI